MALDEPYPDLDELLVVVQAFDVPTTLVCCHGARTTGLGSTMMTGEDDCRRIGSDGMNHTTNFLAIDLGASSGRVIVGRWDGQRFDLRELHRFPNGPVQVLGHLHSDALRLWQAIKTGIAHYAGQDDQPLAGIGIDTWGAAARTSCSASSPPMPVSGELWPAPSRPPPWATAWSRRL